jgi:fumarate hydratase class II
VAAGVPAGQGSLTMPPKILDLPIGLDASGTRTESDSIGEIEVPADHYWGAQTQRSLIHFDIGDDLMPKAVYRGTSRSSPTPATIWRAP